MAAVIQEGDFALLIDSHERHSIQEMKAAAKTKIGKLKCSVAPVIGQQYGSTFKVQNGKLELLTGRSAREMRATDTEQVVEDNRDLVDNNTAQSLTAAEITALKAQVSGEEVIEKLVQNSATFATKTQFSKEKYIKKKQKKYIHEVTAYRTTAWNICNTYFLNNPAKTSYVRADSLAQILTLSNVRPGLKVLVIETCLGLITGAVAERLGGMGTVLNGYGGQQASTPIVRMLNMSSSVTSSIVDFPLTMIGDMKAPLPSIDGLDQTDPSNAATVKRVQTLQLLQEGVDSLIIAGRYDPLVILKNVLPLLKLSGPIVIYSPYFEPLATCERYLLQNRLAIKVQTAETWFRHYQVLSQRTHPHMTMTATGGYVLSAYKIESDFTEQTTSSSLIEPSASSVVDAPMEDVTTPGDDEEPATKRQKVNEDEDVAA
eukprot:GILJ01003420.1.p1 GENE.GILJ01003420.1~~GILJ01003420.1.p1  ORF type:complete len:430 (-),score=78.80 GILJ01003420.1:81-1370(-)